MHQIICFRRMWAFSQHIRTEGALHAHTHTHTHILFKIQTLHGAYEGHNSCAEMDNILQCSNHTEFN
jgi:hypothetical protein